MHWHCVNVTGHIASARKANRRDGSVLCRYARCLILSFFHDMSQLLTAHVPLMQLSVSTHTLSRIKYLVSI